MPRKNCKIIVLQDGLIIPDNRPSDYEYAVLSEHVYKIGITLGNKLQIEDEEWEVVDIVMGGNDYFAVLYRNSSRKQLVLAHRGTQSLANVIEDIQSIILNSLSAQQWLFWHKRRQSLTLHTSSFKIFSIVYSPL